MHGLRRIGTVSRRTPPSGRSRLAVVADHRRSLLLRRLDRHQFSRIVRIVVGVLSVVNEHACSTLEEHARARRAAAIGTRMLLVAARGVSGDGDTLELRSWDRPWRRRLEQTNRVTRIAQRAWPHGRTVANVVKRTVVVRRRSHDEGRRPRTRCAAR